MDSVVLSRLQFAFTAGFHFIFPSITIGLAWILVIVEGVAWRRGDPDYAALGKFLGRLFGLTFVMGVATGVVLEFQFGMNWAEYSKFVGDIFGAPLAAEGVFAFFLESVFLGAYLFGRERLSKGAHWFCALMVAIGATISAFWIIVANSWQQTPTGFRIVEGPLGARAELTSFVEAVFNPSTWVRYFHTVDATLVAGAFFVAGVAAWRLLKGKDVAASRKALKVSMVFGFFASLVAVFPTGHEHVIQVARTQPEKFAAIEALYEGGPRAPLVLAALPTFEPTPRWKSIVEIPGGLSLLAFGDIDAVVQGISDFPEDRVPPLFLTFGSFHAMVGLGMLFIAVTGWGVIELWRGKLYGRRWMLWLLVWTAPLPIVACELGWMTAEVGRQPYIVYKNEAIGFDGMLVSEAVSRSVSAGEVALSLMMFVLIYLLLGALYLYLLCREVAKEAPEPSAPTDGIAPREAA